MSRVKSFMAEIPSRQISSEVEVSLKATFLAMTGDCLRCLPHPLDKEAVPDSQSDVIHFTKVLCLVVSTS